MADLIEIEPDSQTPAVLHDRRRPGRMAFTGAYLLALLRGQPLPDAAPIPDTPPDDATVTSLTVPGDEPGDTTWTAARGVGLGLVLGGAIWVAGLVGLWFWIAA